MTKKKTPPVSSSSPQTLEQLTAQKTELTAKYKSLLNDAKNVRNALRRCDTAEKRLVEEKKRQEDIAMAFKLAELCRKNGINTVGELNVALMNAKHSSHTPPALPNQPINR